MQSCLDCLIFQHDELLHFRKRSQMHEVSVSVVNALHKLKRCLNKECCKQCRYVKSTGTMTKWPVQKLTHRTTQKHVQHHDATDI